MFIEDLGKVWEDRNDFLDQIWAAGKGTKSGRGTRAWDEYVGTFEKAGTIPGRRESVG